MPAVTITIEDLEPFAAIEEAKAEAMIVDAMAMATLVAPCIAEDEFENADAAKAVIRGAILRWNDSGTGAAASMTALSFSQTLDTRQQRRSMFWPSEIEQLQKMCSGDTDRTVWAYDTLGTPVANHADTCSLNFGATYCSCGAILTGYAPLWGE